MWLLMKTVIDCNFGRPFRPQRREMLKFVRMRIKIDDSGEVDSREAKLQSLFRRGVRFGCLKVANMTTVSREYRALASAHMLDLTRAIFRQRKNLIRDEAVNLSVKSLPEHTKVSLNSTQMKAIGRALAVKNGFSLIQGPPGTGKTSTIVELINAVLAREKSARVLGCAPSNAAIDEIVRRLLSNLRCPTTSKTYSSPDDVRSLIVRIGAGARKGSVVKEVSLEKLVQEKS
eukprot:709411_1